MYLVYPPPPHFKFYITIVSNFSCVLQPKSKIMDMKIFFFNLCFFFLGGGGRGVNKVHYVKMVNGNLSPRSDILHNVLYRWLL